MKKFLIIAASVCVAYCALPHASAQPAPAPAITSPTIDSVLPLPPAGVIPPGAAGSFFQSFQGYFTSFDTNSTTFVGNHADIWSGADYVNGVNLASSLGIEYQLKKSFSVESVTRNAGIAGIIMSEQVGVGYNVLLHDLKITGYADAGYRFDDEKPLFEFGLRLKKALTTHTFAGTGLAAQIEPGKKFGAPLFTVLWGFTF